MKKLLATITVGLTLLLGVTAAIPFPLYKGLITPNQTPDKQGWKYLKTSLPTAPSATATWKGTVLDSGNNTNYAGYFINGPFNKNAPFKLDRSTGYTVSFTVQINSESHIKDDRAGFSVIAVSDRLPNETQAFALELGFWTNSIWAYNANGTRGENVSFDTSSTVKHYVLSVKGNQYKLFTKGSTNPILQGLLRQYTDYTPPPGLPNPYKVPNLIFMGDDTTSATAQVTITRVSASPISIIR